MYTDNIKEDEERSKNIDNTAEDQLFIPRARQAYKYLGILKLGRDGSENVLKVENRLVGLVEKILKSGLSVAQMSHVFNSTVIPSAVYVLGNLYPNLPRKSLLKKCDGIDKKIRKIMVDSRLKKATISNNRINLLKYQRGLGFRSGDSVCQKGDLSAAA